MLKLAATPRPPRRPLAHRRAIDNREPRRLTARAGDEGGFVIGEAVRAARERVVLDHFHDEVEHDWDAVLATFPHPRYELVATQRVHDGEEAVRGYYRDTRVAFPDQDHEIIALRHSEDAVIVEFYLFGTHLGPFGPVPPTGGRFKVRCCAFFVFDAGEALVTERIYFDQMTIVRDLLRGPNLRSLRGIISLVRALRGLVRLAGEPKDEIPAVPARSAGPGREG